MAIKVELPRKINGKKLVDAMEAAAEESKCEIKVWKAKVEKSTGESYYRLGSAGTVEKVGFKKEEHEEFQLLISKRSGFWKVLIWQIQQRALRADEEYDSITFLLQASTSCGLEEITPDNAPDFFAEHIQPTFGKFIEALYKRL